MPFFNNICALKDIPDFSPQTEVLDRKSFFFFNLNSNLYFSELNSKVTLTFSKEKQTELA